MYVPYRMFFQWPIFSPKRPKFSIAGGSFFWGQWQISLVQMAKLWTWLRLTFDVLNPYSGDLIDSVTDCGAEEADLAIGKVTFDSDDGNNGGDGNYDGDVMIMIMMTLIL